MELTVTDRALLAAVAEGLPLVTVFSFSVLSSTTTMADCWILPFHTENQISVPSLLNSGCTTRR